MYQQLVSRLVHRIGRFRSVPQPEVVPVNSMVPSQKSHKRLTRKQKQHKQKRKTRKQIERRLLDTGHNRHHRRPRKYGGTLKDENMSWVPIRKHRFWHGLFYVGWPPRERVARPINEIWLDMKFLLISTKTRLFFRAVRHADEMRSQYRSFEDIPQERLLESHRLLVELLDMRNMTRKEYLEATGVTKGHLLQRAIPEDQHYFAKDYRVNVRGIRVVVSENKEEK